MTVIPSLLMRPKLRAALAVVLLVLVILYGLISFFIARGVTTAEVVPQEDHPRNHGLAAEDVEFTERGGKLRLSGWYIDSVAESVGEGVEDAPHLIFVHGLNSVRSGDNALELAARLVQSGYSILMFDLRGHGSSEDNQVSGGYYERRDVWGAYDYLVERRGAVEGKVGLLGFSMGAATAILAAAEEPGIRAVAADSPYAAASELIAQEAARKSPVPSWLMPVFLPTVKLMAKGIYGIDVGVLTPVKAVTQLDYPVLIIHGLKDERVPASHGERVAAAGSEGTVLWLVDAEGHLDSYKTYPDEYFQRVDAYFRASLK